jgi:hypothetical protein
MTFAAPRPVVSGKPYVVRSVRDRAPESLADFIGDTSIVVDLDGEDYTIWGPGVDAGDWVRVYEKTDAGTGKDIRVWAVCPQPDGAFTALHSGIDVPAQAASPLAAHQTE